MTDWSKLPHDGRVFYEVQNKELLQQLSAVNDTCAATKKGRMKILRAFARKLGLQLVSAKGTNQLAKVERLGCRRKLTAEEKQLLKTCATYGERHEQLRQLMAVIQLQANTLAGKGRARRVQLSLIGAAESGNTLNVLVEIGGLHAIQKQLQSLKWPLTSNVVGQYLKNLQVKNERFGHREGYVVLSYATALCNFGWWVLSLPVGSNEQRPEIPGTRRLKHSQFWAKLERLSAQQEGKACPTK